MILLCLKQAARKRNIEKAIKSMLKGGMKR